MFAGGIGGCVGAGATTVFEGAFELDVGLGMDSMWDKSWLQPQHNTYRGDLLTRQSLNL